MKHFHSLFVLMIAMSLGATAQQTPAARPAQAAPAAPSANDTSALEQKVRDLEDRLVLLEGEIRQLKAHGVQPPAPGTAATPEQAATPAAPSTTASADQPRLGGAGGAASKALNPDVSVLGA